MMPWVAGTYWYDDRSGTRSGFLGDYGLVRPDGTASPARRAVATA